MFTSQGQTSYTCILTYNPSTYTDFMCGIAAIFFSFLANFSYAIKKESEGKSQDQLTWYRPQPPWQPWCRLMDNRFPDRFTGAICVLFRKRAQVRRVPRGGGWGGGGQLVWPGLHARPLLGHRPRTGRHHCDCWLFLPLPQAARYFFSSQLKRTVLRE